MWNRTWFKICIFKILKKHIPINKKDWETNWLLRISKNKWFIHTNKSIKQPKYNNKQCTFDFYPTCTVPPSKSSALRYKFWGNLVINRMGLGAMYFNTEFLHSVLNKHTYPRYPRVPFWRKQTLPKFPKHSIILHFLICLS